MDDVRGEGRKAPVMRRVVMLATLACAVGVLSAFGLQEGMVPLHIDLASVLSRLAYGAASLVGASLLWLGKKGLDSINRVESQVAQTSKQLSTISHELFGVGGNNGMRSELKETRHLVQRHAEVLVVLADRAHIAFNKDER